MNQYAIIEKIGPVSRRKALGALTYAKLAFFLGSSAWPDILEVPSLKLVVMVSWLFG